ncbi:hypothetical protein ACPCK3_15020 [Streptomyces griseoincarnatus]
MRKIVLSVVAAVAVVGLVAGCSGGEDAGDVGKGGTAATAGQEGGPGGDAEPAGEDLAKRDVKILDSGFKDHDVWGPGAYVVEYEITNGGKDAANYFVQLEFLDGDKDVLGTTGVSADKLGAGKTHAGDTAPIEAEIENGPMSSIESVRVSMVERTRPE